MNAALKEILNAGEWGSSFGAGLAVKTRERVRSVLLDEQGQRLPLQRNSPEDRSVGIMAVKAIVHETLQACLDTLLWPVRAEAAEVIR